MSFRTLLAGLSLAVIAGTVSADETIHENERLAYRMHHEGLRQEIKTADRGDLADVIGYATKKAEELDLDCQVSRLMEVQLVDSGMAWLAGYEAILVCVDAPTYAEGLYFDSRHAFIGAIAF